MRFTGGTEERLDEKKGLAGLVAVGADAGLTLLPIEEGAGVAGWGFIAGVGVLGRDAGREKELLELPIRLA